MAYTRVVCASMHVLFPIRKFLLCAIAFAPGKLQVVLKVADQSRAGSHFNSQNTHSQFRSSQLAFYPCPFGPILVVSAKDVSTSLSRFSHSTYKQSNAS